ncbi:hypothetical protein [Pseudofrankia sp. DC12]|uniref:hypothetical protein n=1 Tax=Pseudofrankia sp. DC12 TaxID=683315 RepID=UPI000A00543B|nr:hypothetical protein [Pseudofrankia sp. DC12]
MSRTPPRSARPARSSAIWSPRSTRRRPGLATIPSSAGLAAWDASPGPGLVALFHMLDRGEPYRDLGADYFTRRRDPARHAQRLAAQLDALGYDTVITRRPDQATAA